MTMVGPSTVRQTDVAALTTLINMIKFKYMDSVEMYKTMLAILSDFDPNQPGNRERTIRYIRLLITDEHLMNCVALSLPDAEEEGSKKQTVDMREELNPKKIRPSFETETVIIKPSKASPIGPKNGPVRPMVVKTGSVSLCSKSEESLKDLSSEAAASVCKSKSSPQLHRRSHSVTEISKPAIIETTPGASLQKDRHHSLAGTRPPVSMFPFIRHPQAMGFMRPEMTMTTEAASLIYGPTPTLAFPFPYGGYRYPVPFQPLTAISPPTTLAWNPSLQWPQMQYMPSGEPIKAFWPPGYNMAAKTEGLDLTVPPKPLNVSQVSMPYTETASSTVEKLIQLKKRAKSLSSLESSSHSPPKMGKMDTNTAHINMTRSQAQVLNEGQATGTNGGQTPVTNGGLAQALNSRQSSITNGSQTTFRDGSQSSVTSECLALETSVTTEVSNAKHPLVSLQEIVSNIDNTAQSTQNSNVKLYSNTLKTFPYTQEMEIQMSGEKLSEVNPQVNKVPPQTTSSPSLPVNQNRLLNAAVSKPSVIPKRSHSLSDLINLSGPGQADGVGGLGAFVTETSRTNNSTTLKIKLNTSSNGKLLGELLKMQQNRNKSPSVQSPLSKETDKQKNLITRENLSNILGLTQSPKTPEQVGEKHEIKSSDSVKQTPAINTLQIFNSGIPGQTFAIQTKPNFAANRISVTDKAFLQTIKQRLLLKTKQQHQRAHSDSILATVKTSKPSATLSVSSEVRQSSLSQLEGVTGSPSGSTIPTSIQSTSSTSTGIQFNPSNTTSTQNSDDEVDDDVFTNDIVLNDIL